MKKFHNIRLHRSEFAKRGLWFGVFWHTFSTCDIRNERWLGLQGTRIDIGLIPFFPFQVTVYFVTSSYN